MNEAIIKSISFMGGLCYCARRPVITRPLELTQSNPTIIIITRYVITDLLLRAASIIATRLLYHFVPNTMFTDPCGTDGINCWIYNTNKCVWVCVTCLRKRKIKKLFDFCPDFITNLFFALVVILLNVTICDNIYKEIY